jgi:uncharacterized membrane protein YqiK
LSNLTFIGVIILSALVLVGLIGFTLARLYERASKELAFVRTGMGGQKVVKDGGAVVLPVFHETIPINMQTLRLTVERKAKDSLITKDRLRVDVKAEFYVRVSPDEQSIATAAQTLGKRTMAPDQLAVLIEGKFVDVLRAVAAGMDMQDLHEKRADFVKQVQTTVAEDLKKNGLELESVSLTGLDQTSVEHFNPNNAFDAEGLAKLTSVTETRKKERNDIEQENRIAIEQRNFEANKRSLEIKQQDEFATLEQQREVETRRAQQEAELAQTRAEREREAETARIEAERQTASKRIEAERATEAARIDAAQATEKARVEKERTVKVAETEAAQTLQLTEQASRIAVAEKSEAESKARAAADIARAEQVKAAEAVKSVEAEAQAERTKRVAVIAAEQEAEQEATRIRVMAAAELEAADSQAKAKERLVDADAKRYQVEAEGQLALNEAANRMSEAQAALLVRQKFIDALPQILEAMGKPIEKIDSFRVVQMGGGLGGSGSFSQEGETTGSGSFANDLTSSLLKYRMQLPAVDAMAAELGIDLKEGLAGLVEAANAPMVATGTTEVAPAPVVRKASGRVVERPLSAAEKAEIQKLAGVQGEE